ncbi:ribosomal large subunit pseudouridine synthase D [Eubacterium sp. CAG:786]|nr:ribosomal large subunit pseudouridine synthase D [Eubacterium sp. CAG:786]
MCAKNQLAADALSETVSKVYFAITESAPPGDTVNAPVGRVADSVIERCVTPDGKPAITHYVQVNEGSPALLKITLETGRTHQIRVHMAHMGFPLLGDDMYGGDCSAIKRQALHCGEVSFISTVSGNKVTVTAPLPQDMAALIDSTERKTT